MKVFTVLNTSPGVCLRLSLMVVISNPSNLAALIVAVAAELI